MTVIFFLFHVSYRSFDIGSRLGILLQILCFSLLSPSASYKWEKSLHDRIKGPRDFLRAFSVRLVLKTKIPQPFGPNPYILCPTGNHRRSSIWLTPMRGELEKWKPFCALTDFNSWALGGLQSTKLSFPMICLFLATQIIMLFPEWMTLVTFQIKKTRNISWASIMYQGHC